MRTYRVRWDWRGRDWRGHEINLRKGEVVEMDEAVAEWVRADSPGILHEVDGEEQERLIDTPPRDRMVRGSNNRV